MNINVSSNILVTYFRSSYAMSKSIDGICVVCISASNLKMALEASEYTVAPSYS